MYNIVQLFDPWGLMFFYCMYVFKNATSYGWWNNWWKQILVRLLVSSRRVEVRRRLAPPSSWAPWWWRWRWRRWWWCPESSVDRRKAERSGKRTTDIHVTGTSLSNAPNGTKRNTLTRRANSPNSNYHTIGIHSSTYHTLHFLFFIIRHVYYLSQI